MPVIDDFASCMTQAGIAVDATQLPDESTLQAALDYLNSWFYSLTQVEQTAFDAATTNGNPSASILCGNMNVAPAIPGLMQAFDAATGYPLSTSIAYSIQCLSNAMQSASGS